MLVALPAQAEKRRQQKRLLASLFTPSGQCVTCHNNLITPSGQDVSIGSDWSASMMANSARNPYWQAAVRRETMEHPTSSAVTRLMEGLPLTSLSTTSRGTSCPRRTRRGAVGST